MGGLRCGEADQLEIFRDQREVLLLQLVVGRKPQGFHAEGVVEDRRGQAGAGRGEFLGDEHVFEQTIALAAVLPGDIAVHDARLPGLAQDRHRGVVDGVVVPGHRENLLERELPRRFLNCHLFGGELKTEHGMHLLGLGSFSVKG